MNHRRLQRALFRMQHDPGFAERLRAAEPEAVASTGLGPAERACLAAADPAGIAADRDGKRAAQLLSNVSSEFPLSTRGLERDGGRAAWTSAFPASREFHHAVSHDESLPLAFAAFAEREAARRGGTVLAGLVALEAAMARARRGARATPDPGPGEVVLAGTAHLLSVPSGLFAFATGLRVALDRAGAPPPRPPAALESVREREDLLVAAGARPRAFGLRPVRVEPLAPLPAAFLRRARAPLPAAARRAFAAEHDVDFDELASVVKEWCVEGILIGSPDPD